MSAERPTERKRSLEARNREHAEAKVVETKQPEKKEAVKEKSTTPGTGEFLLEERSYYLCNGIQK